MNLALQEVKGLLSYLHWKNTTPCSVVGLQGGCTKDGPINTDTAHTLFLNIEQAHMLVARH